MHKGILKVSEKLQNDSKSACHVAPCVCGGASCWSRLDLWEKRKNPASCKPIGIRPEALKCATVYSLVDLYVIEVKTEEGRWRFDLQCLCLKIRWAFFFCEYGFFVFIFLFGSLKKTLVTLYLLVFFN